ncbi:MAG: efflux RND transporter permease subunit [Planctomycetota bacterium]|nr:efflux RND transporter permease subunit [Planctomycetota bacterium]
MKNRTVIFVGTALLTLWGFAVYKTVPLNYDPSFEFRTAAVITQWPGTNIRKVEELVTYPVEEQMTAIEEVKKVKSTSENGLSIVEVTLENSVTDVPAAWDKIRSEVAKIRVPSDQGCSTPFLDSTIGDIAVLVLSVYQVDDPKRSRDDKYSDRELEVYAERLRDEIRKLRSVADCKLHGAQEEAIFLEASSTDWSQLGVTVNDVKQRLQARNIVASGGSMDLSDSQIKVNPSGNLGTVDQIGNLVIQTDASGTPTYLSDLGVKVVRGYKDPPGMITRFTSVDDRPGAVRPSRAASSVAISVEMKDGNNIVDLGEDMKTLLTRAKASFLPEDIEVSVVVDRPTLVKETVDGFVLSLIESILIVLVVAFLMLGLRMALVMATAIPVVMLTTIALMRFWNIELQQISIGSLIIALGLLVDNAIEVCDNVHRLLHEGYSRFDAAVEGSKQIAFPMIIATGTTIASFLPMAFALEGVIGEYTFSLPMVVSVCLAASWVLAMSFTTVMAYWVLRHTSAASPIGFVAGLLKPILLPGPLNKITFAKTYALVCGISLKFKFLTVAFGVACFMGAGWMMATGKVSSAFFPAASRDQFVVEVYTPPGTPIAMTNEKVKRVEELILSMNTDHTDEEGNTHSSILNLLSFVGDAGPRIDSGYIAPGRSSSNAVLLVRCADYHVVNEYVERIRVESVSKIAGTRVVPRTFGLGEPIDSPIAVRVHSTGFTDLDQVREVTRQVEDLMRDTGRVWNVTNTWGEPGFQLKVDIDANQANRSGVTNANVAQSLGSYLSGEYLTSFREGKHQVPVYFRLPKQQRSDLGAIGQMFVEGSLGKIPFDAITATNLDWQPTRIQRFNMDRMCEVQSFPNPGELATPVLLESIQPKLAELKLPPGFHFEIGGEVEKTNETMPMIGMSGMITAASIIFLLVLYYNSVVKPWLVLLMLPLATAGAIVGLYIFEEPMGFMAQLGLLSLYGIVLNDGIVLVEFIEMLNEERVQKGDGLPEPGKRSYSGLSKQAFRECLVRGAQMRVVPILLTTLTTVGGLVPLLFSGPMFRALAAAMMCGLIVATFMTLLVLPSLMAIFVETFRVSLIHAHPAGGGHDDHGGGGHGGGHGDGHSHGHDDHGHASSQTHASAETTIHSPVQHQAPAPLREPQPGPAPPQAASSQTLQPPQAGSQSGSVHSSYSHLPNEDAKAMDTLFADDNR